MFPIRGATLWCRTPGIFCAFSREKQRLKHGKLGEVQDLVPQLAAVPSEDEVARTSGYVQRRLRENAALVWDALRSVPSSGVCEREK